MLLSEKLLSNTFITDSYLECISENSVNKMKNTLNDYDNVSKEELAELLVNFNLELTRLVWQFQTIHRTLQETEGNFGALFPVIILFNIQIFH